ncbi:Ltp family lipoprotein [Staphylococcus saprophyticus]
MSNDAIYNQLTSDIEGFTEEQAQYTIDQLDK